MTGTGARPLPLDRDGPVRRWQAPAVDVPEEKQKAQVETAADKLLTAERLAAIEEQARVEGHRAGFEEGRQAGHAAGLDEMQRRTAQLTELIDSMTPQLRVLDEALLSQLSELVLVVARQFVRRELRSQPGEVIRVVREALTALPASESKVRVYLNTEDAALVREALAPDSLERPLQILEDMSMSRGGARLETESSVVDASVETRVSMIAARLLGDERRFTEPASGDPQDSQDSQEEHGDD